MPAKKTKKKSKKITQESKENNVDLIDLFSKYDSPKEEEYKMHLTSFRFESFKNWPFDDGASCIPKTLAEAGFYHIPSSESPDATRCFCCYKELDGWEPEDDPWQEHKKRSPHCAHLTLQRDIMEFTVDELIKLECDRQKNKIRKLFHTKILEFEAQSELVKSEMAKLNPGL